MNIEEIKEGMYVKYTRGLINGYVPPRIAKITDCSDKDLIKIDNGQVILRNDILKASKNIIDLIEVGDYVNGYKVIDVGIEEEGYRYVDVDFDRICDELHWGEHSTLQNTEIKTILTKEQFENMSYMVGE